MWRASRRSGGPKRMPKDLWQAAVGLAADHGVSVAASELGVNYGTLRRGLEVEARGDRTVARTRRVDFFTVCQASGVVRP
jgi:hypothetical protein